MDDAQKTMIETYQCPGCVGGSDISCFQESPESLACGKHVAGTMAMPIGGRFFLGLPKGFCRFYRPDTKIFIYKDLSHDWGYDKFNIPVWKHLDENGSTLVRGICPRLDYTWIHIYMDKIHHLIDCIEITKDDIDGMD